MKKKIQEAFVNAMKAKDDVAKSALSSLKAAITLAEKVDGVTDLSEDEIYKIVNKAIKQREESQKIYEDAGRDELARKECDESNVLRMFLPKQMTPNEIGQALTEIMQSFPDTITNPNVLIGKSIGEFNKKYQGRADVGVVKEIATKLIQA